MALAPVICSDLVKLFLNWIGTQHSSFNKPWDCLEIRNNKMFGGGDEINISEENEDDDETNNQTTLLNLGVTRNSPVVFGVGGDMLGRWELSIIPALHFTTVIWPPIWLRCPDQWEARLGSRVESWDQPGQWCCSPDKSYIQAKIQAIMWYICF